MITTLGRVPSEAVGALGIGGSPYHDRYAPLTEIVTEPITGGENHQATPKTSLNSVAEWPLFHRGESVREAGSRTWGYSG